MPPHLSPAAAAEWRALSGERDSDLSAEGAFFLAARLEARGEDGAAALLYETLLETEGLEPELRRRVQRSREGLAGRGSFGQSAERFIRHFIRESGDPAALFAMGAAGAAFRAVRLGSLARLFASPASAWTRGWAARGAAGLSGLAAESLAFPLAGRLGQAALGRSQEWSSAALAREWAGGLLMLGALRLSGTAMGYLARGSLGRSPAGASLFSQTGMLGGILLAQHAEHRMGWRVGTPSMAEALGTLLHFNVAGRLSRAAFGRNFSGWERRMDLQAETLARVASRPGRRVWAVEPLVYAMAAADPLGGKPPNAEGGRGVGIVSNSSFPPSLYRDYRYPSGRGEAKPPRVRYPREAMELWKAGEGRLKGVDPKRPVAELREQAWPLEEANRLWRFQIEDFARLVGASFEVHGADRLRVPLGRGYLTRDPALLNKAQALLGRDAEIYELHFPYSSLRFGEANEAGNFSDLPALLLDLQGGYGHQVFLAYRGNGKVSLRLPSLELWDALNAAHFGAEAHRLIPVHGLIPRDQVMRLRENLLAPLGLVRQATRIQELGGRVHPFFFAFHDGYHASVASTMPADVARLAGRLYWNARRGLPASPLKEELLNRLADLDPGTDYRGDPKAFWDYSLNHYWKFFQRDLRRDDFIERGLNHYPEFLSGYRSVLRRISPQNSEEARALEKISARLQENSRRLSELLVEVLRK